MSNLDDLFFTLKLEDKDFLSKIDSITQKVNSLGSSIDGIKQKLNGLNTNISVSIEGIPKVTDINVNAVLTNKDELRQQIISACDGVEIKNIIINQDSIAKQFESKQMKVQVFVDGDPSTISKACANLQNYLKSQALTAYVKAEWGAGVLAKLESKLKEALKKEKLTDISVTVTRKSVQQQLNSAPFTAQLRLNVNRADVSRTIQNTVNSMNNLGNGGNGIERQIGSVRRLNQHMTDNLGVRRAINDQMKTNTMMATILGNAMGNVFSVYMLQRFLEKLISVGGEIQKQRLALGHILNDVSHANELFSQMKQLAVKSPFGLLDLMQNARQLSAFGVEYNDLYDTMKRLSDMASGLGIQFSRLALAYGETKERGFLDGKLVRQFSYMGLPILQKVAEYYTQINKMGDGSIITASQVRGMVSDKLVSFDDVDAVIKKMTEFGGQFYNMQEVMAESVAGKWKNVADAIDIMMNEIVEGNSEFLKMPAEGLTFLAKNYKDLVPVILGVATAMMGAAGVQKYYNVALGKGTASAMTEALAEKRLEAQQLNRASVTRTLTTAEKHLIKTKDTLVASDFRRSKILKDLSADERRAIIIQQGATRQNLYNLRSIGLITDAQLKAAVANKTYAFSFQRLALEAKLQMIKMKMAVVSSVGSMAASLAAMLPQIAMFAIAWKGIDWVMSLGEEEEKLKSFMDNVRQAREDFRNETNSMADQLQGRSFKSMTFAEAQTAIDDMVTYIKNEVPDANRILREVFETDDSGYFKKSMEERYNALKGYLDGMVNYVQDDTGYTNIMSKVFDNEDLIESVSDFNKTLAKAQEELDKGLSRLSPSQRELVFKAIKREYKDAIMDMFNFTSDAELESLKDDQVEKMAMMNKDMFDRLARYVNVQWTNSALNYKKSWENSVQEIAKTMSEAFKKVKLANHGQFNWSDLATREKWKKEIELNLKAKYPDADADVLKIITMVMNNDALMGKLSVMTEPDKFADELLSSPDLTKNLFLNVSTIFNGVTSIDPWQSIFGRMRGKIKTEDTQLTNNADKTKEQYISARKMLEEELPKYKRIMADLEKTSDGKYKSKVTGINVITQEYKDQVESSANDINKMIDFLEDSKKGLERLGIDPEELWKEANKKGGSKSNKDTVLENLKALLDELKKTYNEFNKWSKEVGKSGAGEAIEKSGIFDLFGKIDFSKPEAYLEEIKKLRALAERELGKLGSKGQSDERKKFLTNLLQLTLDIQLDIKKESIKRVAEKAQTEFTLAMKKYDIWKSWFDVTGDNRLATSVALNIVPIWDDKAKWLRDAFEKEAISQGMKIDFDYNMTDIQASEVFGGKGYLLEMYKQVRDAFRDGSFEAAKELANAVGELKNKQEEINAIYAKYAKLIENDKKVTGGKYTDRLTGARDYKVLSLSDNYNKFMYRNLNSTYKQMVEMSKAIKDELTKSFKKGGMTAQKYAEEIKKVDDTMGKYQKQSRGSGMFGMDSFEEKYQKQYEKGYQMFQEGAEQENFYKSLSNFTGKSSEMSGQMMQSAQGMQQAGQGMMQGAQQGQGSMAIIDMIIHGINDTVQGLKQSLEYIDEMRESFGADTGADTGWGKTLGYFNTFAESSQHATNGWDNLKNGNIAGAVAETIGSITSIFTGINKTNDSALEEQNQKLELQNRILENISGLLEKKLDKTLGGLYSIKLDADTKKKLEEISNDGKSYEAQGLAKKALEDDSYYQAQYAMLVEQRDNLQRQYDNENKKKNSDDGKLEDYRNSLEEIKFEMDNFTSDMMESLYNINIKDWAGQIGDALMNAWKNGENAVLAYKQTVSDVLSSVMSSVIQQQYIEKALAPLAEQLVAQVQKDNGLITDESKKIMASLNTMAQTTVNDANSLYNAWEEYMQQSGNSFKAGANSSLGNSIEGIREDTADMLGSYVNQIAIDAKLSRIAEENLLYMLQSADYGLEKLTSLNSSQLAQLEMIARNTQRNYESVERIESLFNDVTNGNKTVYMN